MTEPFIIAEVGSNWKQGPDPKKAALDQIEIAAHCGASAVKFQLFTHEELYGFPGPNDWSLPRDWFEELALECQDHSVEFMCSAFSPEGIEFLQPFVNYHKLASSEFNHPRMLEAIIESEKHFFISTGACTEKEIRILGNVLLEKGIAEFSFLECVAAYPARVRDYRLSFIPTLLEYGLSAGISDHTYGMVLAVAAVGAGATIFEKHFDGLGISETPDSKHSMNSDDFTIYCESIRLAYEAAEDYRPQKFVVEDEREMLLKHKRRIIATKPIKRGEVFSYGDNYGIFRSKTDQPEGMPPYTYLNFDGKTAPRDLQVGDCLPFLAL